MTGDVAQVVECLPNRLQALSSNSILLKKKEGWGGEEGGGRKGRVGKLQTYALLCICVFPKVNIVLYKHDIITKSVN
jgi:hypothetical protein